MKRTKTHQWPRSVAEARELQQALRHRVIRENRLGPVRLVAGVDVGFKAGGDIARAAVAVLRFPELELVESAVAEREVRFPYVPGYLSFREAPAVLAAVGRLRQPPDLILCDGQGLAHPRRFGLACHLGVLLDTPTIGAAKTRLVGEHRPVPERKGSWRALKDKGETVGAVVRTRTGVKPLFVSIGHRVDLRTAIHFVLASTTRYRLPETTRWAHRLASG